MTHICPQCGDDIDPRRYALGYRVCLFCGEDAAKAERRGWTVAPLHKSNYMLLTDRRDLMGINNKGGLHR
jgi:ribosomal protein L37AE/L43A